MVEERGSLTVYATWYYDQKNPEATAVTGFRTRICKKNSKYKDDKFYQLFK